MCVDPDNAAGAAVRRGETAERAEGDRMVAAEDERVRASSDGSAHLGCDLRAGGQDLRQVAGTLVSQLGRLLDCGLDIAEILNRVAEGDEPLLEVGIAHRRRAHVHAASALAEVEGGADDRDRLPGHGTGA